MDNTCSQPTLTIQYPSNGNIIINGISLKPTSSVILDAQKPNYTYTLTKNNGQALDIPVWTTASSTRVKNGKMSPNLGVVATGIDTTSIQISAAKQEFEFFQLIIAGPTPYTLQTALPNSVMVSIDNFTTIPNAVISLFQAVYDSNGYADELTPINNGDTINLTSAVGSVIVGDIYVPIDASAGSHQTNLHLGTVAIPVNLYVFDFTIPLASTLKSFFNFQLVQPERVQKQLLFNHRQTPTTVTWPTGFSYKITWDTKENPKQCQEFYNESDEGSEYGIWSKGPEYVLGKGWNNVGFSSNLLFQFVDNSHPRPDVFCNENLGTSGPDQQGGSDAYNTAWQKYLKALRNYLYVNNMLNKSYYYVQNEPQDSTDYQLAAKLCYLVKSTVKDLKIAISKQPIPEIYNDNTYQCSYDIWISWTGFYNREAAWDRIGNYGEEVWFYSLEQDQPPLPNPTSSQHIPTGIEVRILAWIAWMERLTGYAYYAPDDPTLGGWWYGPNNPGLRAKILRDGMEDYEYFVLANQGKQPQPYITNNADPSVGSIATSLTVWLKNPDALQTLRYELGRYIEGKRTTVPTLILQQNQTIKSFYFTFQDPRTNGKGPLETPIIVNNHTYTKVGWGAYNETIGWGMSGENVDPTFTDSSYDGSGVCMYENREDNCGTGCSLIEAGFIYNDNGRQFTFTLNLANGGYNITVSVGWPGKSYSDAHQVLVQGIWLIDNEPTSGYASTNFIIKKSMIVNITDGTLVILCGGKSRTTDQYSYTFLQYMNVEPV